MNINRISFAGFTGKDAEGNWQEKTQGHACTAYGQTAEYATRIQTGMHVFLEGELTDRESTIAHWRPRSGPVKVQWPVTEIVIDSLAVLERKEREKRKGAA